MTAPFRLGDHTFNPDDGTLMAGDDVEAFLSRLEAPPKRILGAEPPSAFAGFCREAREDLVSSALREGACCGHNGAYTVFDVVIEGEDVLEILVLGEEGLDDEDGEFEAPVLVLARPRGSEGRWLVVFDPAWDSGGSPTNMPDSPRLVDTPVSLDDEDLAQVREQPGKLSIGFEYPSEATSVNDVSWIAVHALPADGEAPEPFEVVSYEMM